MYYYTIDSPSRVSNVITGEGGREKPAMEIETEMYLEKGKILQTNLWTFEVGRAVGSTR